MTVLDAWGAEDLCAAVLLEGGAMHVEKAGPRRVKHHANGTTERRPAFDFFECIDVLALFPSQVTAVQVKTGKASVSDAMVLISEKGPWPYYFLPEVWKWRRREMRFDVWFYGHKDQEWIEADPVPVPNPQAMLDRADTGLDKVIS